MKTINKNSIWLPGFFDNFLVENKVERLPHNYETFSLPRVNIIENLPNFVIELAMPGLQKENITIEVEEETLQISAKVLVKEVENDSRYNRREFDYNNFKRSFKLPENIDVAEIQAKYENGILKVTLPKMEEKKALKKMVEIS